MIPSIEIEVNDCLDYLRFSAGRENNIDELLPKGVPSLSRTGEVKEHGSYGYDRTCPLEGGGRIMFHTNDHGMKYCIELSGEPLAEVRRDGFEVEDILAHTFSGLVARSSYSRIDYAIDVINSEGSIEGLYDSWIAKETKTLARQAMFIQKAKSEYRADTVYFGNRESSPRFIRAYNKGAQSGNLEALWLRMELESKKRRVNGFAWSVLQHGRSEAGRRELKDAINTPIPWVVLALTGELSPKVEAPRPEARPNEFVRNMLIPFIRNHSRELSQETKALLLMTIEDYVTLT